jgi:maltose O-acetyltransferase
VDNRRRKQLLIVGLANSNLVPNSKRGRILKWAGVSVAPGSFVSSGCQFVGDAWMFIGSGSSVGYQSYFDFAAPIRIGNAVRIGAQAMIVTGGHEIGPSARRGGDLRPQPVTIGDGAWLGARALILPGVTVAPGCVVAAGAVVSRDTEPDGLYAGVPARRIKDLSGT